LATTIAASEMFGVKSVPFATINNATSKTTTKHYAGRAATFILPKPVLLKCDTMKNTLASFFIPVVYIVINELKNY